MATRVTSSNTKAQIMAAYKEALAEAKAKDNEIKRLQRELKSAQSTTSAAAPAAKSSTGAPATVAGVVASLEGLGEGFGNAVSGLSGTLSEEATRLEALRAESAALTNELRELHGIDVQDGTLGGLIEELQNKIEAFEEEQDEKRETFDKELSEKRAAWKQEREEHAAKIKERDGELRKARKRESDEYKYDLGLRRNAESDVYAQQLKAQDAELADIREAANKELGATEAELAEREKAAKDTNAKAAKLDKELETAVKKAQEEGAGIARRQAKIAADLLAKEHEGRRRVYELRVSTMEETIAKQTKLIESLSTQLDAALKQAQDLAVKAIEGASNATSFEAIREIAMEQAKTPQKGK